MNVQGERSIPLPEGFMAQSILDQNLDSKSYLCTNRNDEKYEIRIFNFPEKAEKALLLYANSPPPDSKNRLVIPSHFVVRNTHCFVRKFHWRTLLTLAFFNNTLFDDEKHAICLQLVQIVYLLPNQKEYPVLPSRFLVHEDLYVEFTDFYEPNPIDDEALEFGWYEADHSPMTMLRRIIQKIWDFDEEGAEIALKEYEFALFPEKNSEQLTSFIPIWHKQFMTVHRANKDLNSLPPLLQIDLSRIVVSSGETLKICRWIIQICKMIPHLDIMTLKMRVAPIITSLMKLNHDQVVALSYFALVKLKIEFRKHKDSTPFLKREIIKIPGGSNSIKAGGDDIIIRCKDGAPKLQFVTHLTQMATSSSDDCRMAVIASIPDVLVAKGPEVTKKLIRLLFKNEMDSAESDVFCNKFIRIAPQLKSKMFTVRVLEKVRLSDAMMTALISIPKHYFNVDAIIARMSTQVLTQFQARFLLYSCDTATPAMIFKFSYKDILEREFIQSLVREILIRMKKRVHPADYKAIIGDNYGHQIPFELSPEPAPLKILDEISSMVSDSPITKPDAHSFNTPKAKWSGNPITIPGRASAAAFSYGGLLLLLGDENGVSAISTESIRARKPDKPKPLVTIEKVTHIEVTPSFIFIVSGDRTLLSFEPDRENPLVTVLKTFDSDITAVVRHNETNLVFILESNGGTSVSQGRSCHKKFQIPPSLGQPLSLASIQKETAFVIGTSDGYLIRFDLKLQCPLKIIRLSNMPARLARYDQSAFVATAGPYAVIIDKELRAIRLCMTQPHSYVTRVCVPWMPPQNDTALEQVDVFVTAHTDFAMRAWKDKKAINLVGGPSQTVSGDIWVSSSNAPPCHTSPILSLQTAPGASAVVSVDTGGLVYVWPISLDRFK